MTFCQCIGVDTSDAAWQQAQLSLSRFWSLSHHSSAAFISSLCSSGFGLHSSPPYAPLALVCIHLLLMLLWLWSAFISSLCSSGYGLHSPPLALVCIHLTSSLCSSGFGLHSSPPYAPLVMVCIHLLWLWSAFISPSISSSRDL